MREPYAKELGLVYDASKIITGANCKLWSDFDPEKDFPGEGELRMTAFPRGIPFGQGAEVPQSFKELLDLIKTEKPTILNSTPVPGLADALRALQKNEYYSFFGKPNLYGMTKGKFLKEFQNKAKAITFCGDMMVEEKNATSQSPNGLQHSIQFVDKLNQAIRYAKIVCPTEYAEALNIATPAKSATRKVKFKEYQEDDLSVNSNDSTHHRKRGKQEGVNTAYMSRYYTFFLGAEVNEHDSNQLQWVKRDVMHPLFKKLKGNGFLSKLQGIRTKWDKALRETRSDIYLQVPDKTLIWSHILLKKLQAADWSTDAAGKERPSQICLRVFTLITANQ